MPITSHAMVGNDQPLHGEYTSFPITASDSVDLPVVPGQVCVGVIVTTGGNIAATTLGGVAVTFTSVPANTPIDATLRRVLSTGTTASGLSALYRPRER